MGATVGKEREREGKGGRRREGKEKVRRGEGERGRGRGEEKRGWWQRKKCRSYLAGCLYFSLPSLLSPLSPFPSSLLPLSSPRLLSLLSSPSPLPVLPFIQSRTTVCRVDVPLVKQVCRCLGHIHTVPPRQRHIELGQTPSSLSQTAANASC